MRYTEQEVRNAYLRWVAARKGIDREHTHLSEFEAAWTERKDAWDSYCDARDDLGPGTSRSRRIRAQSHLMLV
jgi:hypothetical protein